MMGRHRCTKPKNSPTYDPRWSGFSTAPHVNVVHQKCGEQLHDEDGTLYCPKCDDQVGETELIPYYLKNGIAVRHM